MRWRDPFGALAIGIDGRDGIWEKLEAHTRRMYLRGGGRGGWIGPCC